MCLIADRLGVGPSRSNQKIKGLHTRIARALRHNIEKLSVGLGMQLIEDYAMNVKAVLGVSFGRQYLIKAVCWGVDDPLRCR